MRWCDGIGRTARADRSLIDEGSGLLNTWGQQFALPGVAEKGSFNLQITVETLGGHSSVPPTHTGIGLISLLLAELERNPHNVFLTEENPIYGFVTCAAGHASGVPTKLRDVVVKARSGNVKAWNVLPEEIVRSGVRGAATGPGQGNAIEALMRTTQAADIINGGIKVNALVRARATARVELTLARIGQGGGEPPRQCRVEPRRAGGAHR